MADDCKCKYTVGVVISSLIGLLLSVYTSYVETVAEKDHDYRAMCDISEKISCTKVFTSRYGKGFGIFGEDSFLSIPNGVYGIAFYSLIIVLSFINNLKAAEAQIILSAISNMLSLYLAYLLYFVLEDLCVVCVSTYAVNFANILISLRRYQHLKQLSTSSRTSATSSAILTPGDLKKVD